MIYQTLLIISCLYLTSHAIHHSPLLQQLSSTLPPFPSANFIEQPPVTNSAMVIPCNPKPDCSTNCCSGKLTPDMNPSIKVDLPKPPSAACPAEVTDPSDPCFGVNKGPQAIEPLSPAALKGGCDAATDPDCGMQDIDEKEVKFNKVLDLIKQSVKDTHQQVLEEQDWVSKIKNILTLYGTKSDLVQAHVTELKEQLKKLRNQRLMVRNLLLQHRLEKKLKEAHDDRSQIMKIMPHVEQKFNRLSDARSQVRNIIDKLSEELTKLRGMDESSGSSSSELTLSQTVAEAREEESKALERASGLAAINEAINEAVRSAETISSSSSDSS